MSTSSLTTAEKKRYNRHLILSEFGLDNQEKLKQAKVLVIGAGGLGSPILQYLTAAGVGTIGIVDDDVVDESNLQRQVLFSTQDIGKSKSEVAKEKLTAQNPFVLFTTYNERLTNENALSIFKDYDIVVDGSDNFPTRYLVNDACVILNKVLVFGAIFKFDGQLSVFNYDNGPTYRCLFPEPPSEGEVPNCSEIGVIGVLPGLIGTMMANEVIKVITGIGEVLSGKLLVLNTLTMNQQVVRFEKDKANSEITELMDYERFCGIGQEPKNELEKSITPVELAEKLKTNTIHLLDVREPFEYEICHIKGSQLVPLQQIPALVEKIDRETPTVVICHHGMRSASAIRFLEENHGFMNLTNLSSGIDGWAREVDIEMEKY
ncbi:MAG: molybdopterin-synthase adenylyltransferase MoeB [Cyclobacteriaceae bacterium]